MIKCENCEFYHGHTLLIKNKKYNKDFYYTFNCNAINCPNISFNSKSTYKNAILDAINKEKV